jgi:5-methyltetrahydropteroyltriglutamate--homocysteine methyltransferase
MNISVRPPFRADHVGSLLRPAPLRAGREQGLTANAAAYRKLEDECIKGIIALQESIGLHAITDGELRRNSFNADFIEKLDGAYSSGRLAVPAAPPEAGASDTTFTPRAFAVTGKLRHTQPIELENFRFLKAHSGRTAKQSIPSPTMLLRGGREAVSREAYPDLAEFRRDVVAVYREELRQLGEAGCTYLQLDDTNFAYLCDPRLRESHRQFGDDPDIMADRYADLINAAIADRPAGMTIAVHICRGNSAGRWAAQGGYEPVADCLFNRLDVDAYFLEFDDARSGGFDPLRLFPRASAKKVVLGLVSSKVPEIESSDLLKRRIEGAAQFVPLDRLCLSPQCGFASTFRGNPVTEDIQRRKLERVVEVALAVWGTAAG